MLQQPSGHITVTETGLFDTIANTTTGAGPADARRPPGGRSRSNQQVPAAHPRTVEPRNPPATGGSRTGAAHPSCTPRVRMSLETHPCDTRRRVQPVAWAVPSSRFEGFERPLTRLAGACLEVPDSHVCRGTGLQSSTWCQGRNNLGPPQRLRERAAAASPPQSPVPRPGERSQA